MQQAYIMSGSKVHVKRFQVGETMAKAGVPVVPMVPGGAAVSGILKAGTATAVDSLGLTLDTTGTHVTSQQADNSDPAQFVSVIVNPDLVMQCRLNGSASAPGTALELFYNLTQSTTGLTVAPSTSSGGAVADASAMDDCTIFGYSGANAGIARKISAVTAVTFDVSVAVAFPHDIEVDDQFIFANFSEGVTHFVTLTSDLDEADSQIATGEDTNNKNYRPVDLIMNDVGNDGLNKSYVNLIAFDHAFSGSALA